MSAATYNYNKTHGVFTRRELRILAQALGLSHERIDQRLNKLNVEDAIRTTKLLTLIEQGVFVADFDHLYNNQSGRYNSLVLAKALQLVDAHLFGFDEILKARLAFDLYEINAGYDRKKEMELIWRTIRFCDYRISPLKLEQRLRHLRLGGLRKLHLCDYFDLLLVSNQDSKSKESFHSKTIDLANPKPIEQQLMDELNTNYLRDERNWFFEERSWKGKLLESAVWPAKLAHRYQTDEADVQKAQLQRQLSASASSLRQSRAGSACSTKSHLHSSTSQRSIPISSCSFTSISPVIDRSSLNSFSNQQTPEKEIKTTAIQDRLEQLRCESIFIATKYDLYREDYMNELLPTGYVKPVIVSKPIERRKRPKAPLHWSRRAKSAHTK